MRKKIILKIHYSVRRIRGFYRQFFKKKSPWGKSKIQLLTYPQGSLGRALGEFLEKHPIEIAPQFENHDVMHVLTDIGILFVEEIALKSYLLGNGRHHVFHLLSTVGGVLAYPEKYQYFKYCYLLGKKAQPFHHIDFIELLNHPIEELRANYQIVIHSSLIVDTT